jgi:hypothetical protein
MQIAGAMAGRRPKKPKTSCEGLILKPLRIPDEPPPSVAEAEVVRHAVGATGEDEDMGLRFISFRDGRLDRLGRFLESLSASAVKRCLLDLSAHSRSTRQPRV